MRDVPSCDPARGAAVRRRAAAKGRCLAVGLLCLANACATTRDARSIDAAAAELAACEDLVGGRVGIFVLDAATGAVLADRSGGLGFAPASNQKLVSAAVALRSLGPEHRMATELWQDGPVRDGVLHGDLVLRGFGDPTLGKPGADGGSTAKLVAAVRELGIRRATGRVIGDGAWQGDESLGLGWQWDHLDEGYAAPFGGLDFAGNVVTVTVRPDQGRAAVDVSPAGACAPAADVVVGPTGATTRLSAHRQLGTDTIEVRGSIAADAPPQRLLVAVREPAVFAAAAFRGLLQAAGVEVEGAVADHTSAAAGQRLVARVESPPLRDVLQPLLTNSDNLYAEQVWRVAARVASGQATTTAAAQHASAVLTDLGVDVRGMVMADGSGLSRRNLVQPRQLAGVLRAMYSSPHRQAFVGALPLAGETGTLRSRFAAGPAHAHVRAKTGYISRVVCLSGFVLRPDPEAPPLVFSVMLNDFTCSDEKAKAAVDAFVQRLAAAAGWPG